MKTPLDCLVVTYGGAGSSFLLEFLSDHLRTNDSVSHIDGLKHIHSPQHPILDLYEVKRAVYIFADPVRAILSVFRRGYQHVIPKVNANHRSVTEYLDYIAKNTPDLDLDEFVRTGIDLFNVERHFHNWTSQPAPFPRLCLKYEHLFAQLPRLFSFLGLSDSLLSSFPDRRPRASSLEIESRQARDGLEAMYGALSRRLASLPPCWEIPVPQMRPAGASTRDLRA